MAAVTKNKGYTLIELVVVVGLVGMLSVGMVSVFLASLRGSARAQVEAEVRSQGDYAIAKIERDLRSAQFTPDCPSTSKVSFRSGGTLKSFEYFEGPPQTIINESSVPLFGTNVRAYPVEFTCDVGEYGYGSVTISFTLTADGKMAQTVSQTFKTTVAIRSVK